MTDPVKVVLAKGGKTVLPRKKKTFDKKIISPENNRRFGGRA